MILGTGRSGTDYMCHWLNWNGVLCGHEEVYSVYGYQGWGDFRAESSWVAATQPIESSVGLLHIVRDPLAVLRSQLSSNLDRGGFWNLEADDEVVGPFITYMQAHCPEAWEQPDDMGRAITFIVEWNKKCAERNSKWCQLEEVNKDSMSSWASWLGLNHDFENPDLKNTINIWPHHRDDLTWETVKEHPLGYKLVEHAVLYGYST